MADTQATTSFTVENPGPLSGPNPFGFADLQAARNALTRHLANASDNEFWDLEGLTNTIYALAMSAREVRDERVETAVDGFGYLSENLQKVQRELEKWHEKAWQLAVIVNKQDLDALASHPRYSARA